MARPDPPDVPGAWPRFIIRYRAGAGLNRTVPQNLLDREIVCYRVGQPCAGRVPKIMELDGWFICNKTDPSPIPPRHQDFPKKNSEAQNSAACFRPFSTLLYRGTPQCVSALSNLFFQDNVVSKIVH